MRLHTGLWPDTHKWLATALLRQLSSSWLLGATALQLLTLGSYSSPAVNSWELQLSSCWLLGATTLQLLTLGNYSSLAVDSWELQLHSLHNQVKYRYFAKTAYYARVLSAFLLTFAYAVNGWHMELRSHRSPANSRGRLRVGRRTWQRQGNQQDVRPRRNNIRRKRAHSDGRPGKTDQKNWRIFHLRSRANGTMGIQSRTKLTNAVLKYCKIYEKKIMFWVKKSPPPSPPHRNT